MFSIPSLYFTYLVLGLALFLWSIFCPGSLSFFLTLFFFLLFIEKRDDSTNGNGQYPLGSCC